MTPPLPVWGLFNGRPVILWSLGETRVVGLCEVALEVVLTTLPDGTRYTRYLGRIELGPPGAARLAAYLAPEAP